MDPNAGHVQLFHDPLIAVIEGAEGNVTPQLRGEHEVMLVVPGRSGCRPPLLLQRPLLAKEVHHVKRGNDQTALAVFCRIKAVAAVLALAFIELLVDQDAAAFEVHAVPHQAEELTFPQAGKHEDDDHDPVTAVLDGCQQAVHLLVGQRLDLFLEDAGRDAVVSGVDADIVQADRLLQNAV